ncbi:ABC transporter permease [Microbacterium sp. A588]
MINQMPGGASANRVVAWARNAWPGLIGLAIILIIWQSTVTISGVPVVVLPTVTDVMDAFVRLVSTSSFWGGLGVSILEFILGFVVGTTAGVIVGLVLSALPRLGLALNPVIEILRFIVPFAWIPLTILWFGTSIGGKVFLVAYAVFFVMLISTSDAVRNVDSTLLRVATMLGMSRWQSLFRVQFRAAAPSILNSSRAAAGLGWIAVVAAEYVGSSAGLGYIIINASSSLDTPVVIAIMVVIGLVGAAVSWLIGLLTSSKADYSA